MIDVKFMVNTQLKIEEQTPGRRHCPQWGNFRQVVADSKLIKNWAENQPSFFEHIQSHSSSSCNWNLLASCSCTFGGTAE